MKNKYSVGDLHYDAKIYDGLNTHDYDLQFYKKWLHDNISGKVLELCCGSGRLTIPLYESGVDISGIDFNNAMLEEAKQKSKDKGLNIEFQKGDMLHLNLSSVYNTIFIPFNSIHVLYSNEDFINTMDSVKKHLSTNGFFLLDYFNPSIQYITDNENKSIKLKEFTTEDNRDIVIYQNMQYESNNQINRIKWDYYINGVYNSTENLDMRIFYPKELDYLLETNGFKIIKKYGGFDFSDFTAESPEQIYICQKS